MGKKRPAFKPYEQGQVTFLPYSLEELVPEGHIVRVVNDIINKIDSRPLYDQYAGGGASSFNPVMMLKVIIYAYTQKIYSCRSIAKNCRENVMFMWLSGMNTPDYKTINRFRSDRMKPVILDVFSSVVALLHYKSIDRENLFSGTELEQRIKFKEEEVRVNMSVRNPDIYYCGNWLEGWESQAWLRDEEWVEEIEQFSDVLKESE